VALKRFTIYDLIIIAVMAALGIALKPIIVAAVHIVSTPLMLPGGSLAGGLYMMWLVLAFAITRKAGTGTLVGLVQAIMIMLLPIPGSHGAMSLISYTAPGIALDALMLLMLGLARRDFDRLAAFLGGLVTNLAGTLMTNVIFMKLPAIPLAVALCAASLSGGLGGLIAWGLYKVIKKYRLVRNR
jgi:hypothetical protein